MLFAYSLLALLTSEERQVNRRLKRLSTYEAQQAREAEPLLAPFLDRAVRPILTWAADRLRTLAPADYRARVKTRLVIAGNPRGLEVDRLMGAKAASALGIMAAFVLMGLVSDMPAGRAVFAVITLGPIAFFLPDLWVEMRISDRQKAIRLTLPDMLDMLTISVEAGLGFDAALAKLIAKGSGPLTEEFAKMLQEVQAGISRRDAFRHLGDRTKVPELDTFIMSMIQADVFGISISNVLRAQSHDVRTRRRQHAEETAQKAPVKMVFPIILCIMPATLIVILGPAIVDIGRAFGLIGQ
jgi:tight adherence protein C